MAENRNREKPKPGLFTRLFGSGPSIKQDRGKPTKQQMGAHLGYWLVALALVWFLQAWWVEHASWQPIPYSQFLQLLHDHKIQSAEVEGRTIYGSLKEPLEQGKSALFVTTTVPNDLADQLRTAGVEFTGVVPNPFWSNLLSWLVPVAIFYALWALVWRRAVSNFGGMGGGLMSIGRSNAKVYV
ncbi:MAG: ATP-dependent metallopeptidase FtsH/Yme1/Tma family protein, partial [Acetobacteraceae bacterium]|nr:ATP-dependent metallopeptidase FtsH/Yme1/Tma family protein [Acetobacteraceae bacterium]